MFVEEFYEDSVYLSTLISKIVDTIEIYVACKSKFIKKSGTTALPSCTQHVLSSEAEINEKKKGCHRDR